MVSVKNITTFDAEEDCVGILIGYTSEQQLHCGITYKSDESKFNVLHLAWHHLLCHETSPQNFKAFSWVSIPLHLERASTIPPMCQLILERNATQREKGNGNKDKIAYGIRYKGSEFLKDGQLSLGEGCCGLTCATFVMAVFHSCRIEIIDYGDNWILREEDADWQQDIIARLQKAKNERGADSGITDEHIESIKQEVGCARFRPEEVAASLQFDPMPAKFEDIIKMGAEVKKLIAPYEKATHPHFCR